MLICLFKLEDVGPTLADMVVDKNVEIDEEVIDKFQFSGSFTYSLIFQGMVTIEDFVSELYGPFPFAFSNGFVQYAFPFITGDKSVKDKRMKKKTFGLILMLVPEMVSKIDTFREELAKLLIYEFHKIYKISQVDEEFLTKIIKSYHKIINNLLSTQQTDILSDQIFEFIKIKDKPKKKREISKIAIIYPEEYIDLIKKIYASFLSSVPYVETSYTENHAKIKSKKYLFSFVKDSSADSEFINSQDALIFVVDVVNKKYKELYSILAKRSKKLKVALVVSLPDNIEKASVQYAKFFTKLQVYISDLPFFSANFTSRYDFKSKMLEALFWTLTPIQ